MKISKIPVFIVTFLMMFTLSCGLVGATDFVGGEFVDLGDVPKEEEISEEPPIEKPPTEQPPKEEPPVESMPIVEPPEIVEEIPFTESEPKAEVESLAFIVSSIRNDVQSFLALLNFLLFWVFPVVILFLCFKWFTRTFTRF